MKFPFVVNLDEYLSSRDCLLFHKGDSMPMRISANLARVGWDGGCFVRWIDDGSGIPCLEKADGRYCGFLPFGSNEVADQLTSLSGQNPHYGYVSLYYGGNYIGTRTFERFSYASRHGGPLEELVYTPQSYLFVSENGKITIEDESDPLVNPSGLFPDGTPIETRFLQFGICSLPPSDKTRGRMLVQTNIGV